MRYRVKEECGLCGKTLLLGPHLKNTHKLKTWDEYIIKLKGLSKRKNITANTMEIPSGGLHSLLKEINPVAAVQRKPRKHFRETIPSSDNEEKGEPSPRGTQNVKVPYTEEEFLRFCVHNTNLYMVLATHQAMKNGKKDPVSVLKTRSQ